MENIFKFNHKQGQRPLQTLIVSMYFVPFQRRALLFLVYKLSKQDDVILNLLFPKLCKFQNRSMLRNWCVPYWRCKFKSCQRSIEFRIPVSSERNISFHRNAQSPDLWQKYQSQNLLSNSQLCYLRPSNCKRLQNFFICYTLFPFASVFTNMPQI